MLLSYPRAYVIPSLMRYLSSQPVLPSTHGSNTTDALWSRHRVYWGKTHSGERAGHTHPSGSLCLYLIASAGHRGSQSVMAHSPIEKGPTPEMVSVFIETGGTGHSNYLSLGVTTGSGLVQKVESRNPGGGMSPGFLLS